MSPGRFPALARGLLASLAWVAGGAARAGTSDGPALARQAVASTVSLEADRGPLRSAGMDELASWVGRPAAQPGPALTTGTGSGVIVRPEGLILTNQHVVAEASQVRVELYDHTVYSGRVLASDPRTDVALVQIEGKGPFSYSKLGDSDRVAVGDPVLTVGHPFDFDFSVSSGIVSAVGRRNVADDEIQDYIQMDAAVNPGGSGGPLLNARGEVIGITTAIYSSGSADGPAATGLSFAIPIRLAWGVAQELLAGQTPRRPWLGVEVADLEAVTPELHPGVRVVSVVPGSPAERAGLRVEDRILAVNDQILPSRAEFCAYVRSRSVGDALRVRILRDLVVQELRVPAVVARGAPSGTERPADAFAWAGMTLAPRDGGVGVLAVDEGSAAWFAGVEVGDTLRALDGVAVSGEGDLRHALEGHKAVTAQVGRREGTVAVVLVAP